MFLLNASTFVHQKSKRFNLLGNYDFFLNIKKITIETYVKNDIKSKAGWLKKKGFLPMI